MTVTFIFVCKKCGNEFSCSGGCVYPQRYSFEQRVKSGKCLCYNCDKAGKEWKTKVCNKHPYLLEEDLDRMC